MSQDLVPLSPQATLIANALRVLSANDVGSYTRPSPSLYPHQWNWDSAFVAIGLARDRVERAQLEIRSLLRGQWRNGMVPHIVYDSGGAGYFPDAARWEVSLSPDSPNDVSTSGITQPPMITVAVHAIARDPQTHSFVRWAFPHLLQYHRWLHRERDPEGEGLVFICHPWESGLDNSPRWLDIMSRMMLTVRPSYEREDNRQVALGQRPTDEDYDRFVYLLDLAREARYDSSEIWARSPFLVQDVLFNSILYRADECLKEMAVQLGEPIAEMERWMALSRRAFRDKLWDSKAELYRDYDLRSGRPILENTISIFMPLYAGVAGERETESLVERHLRNPAEYAADNRTQWLVPTASKDNHHFDPVAYWRGPVWVNTNWFLIRGLERYHYWQEAEKIRRDTLALVERTGFFEYFDPGTGAGYGTGSFSWSAALTLDLQAH